MRKLLLSITLLLAVIASFGQQTGLSEQDMIKKASSFYDKEIWEEALPLYAQLVSIYPNHTEYNYKFGVCTLNGDKTNATRAVRYLTFAHQTMKDDPEVIYYLGIAYYQNQEFATALQYFFKCLEKYTPNSPEAAEINDHINLCQRGLVLIHKNHLDEIITKNEYQYENFHRAYPANELEGSLIKKPDHFTTAQEISKSERSYVYITEPRGTVYYSGYSDENQPQRDLFVISLNANGEWGEPAYVSGGVNTIKDEAYPVLADEGKTLYFSSKGHNSMGGYDIFKSTFNEVTGTFGPPQNMGVGINSPYDDILFIPDKSGNGAYFASNRENTVNNVTVFKISLNSGMVDQQEYRVAENSSPDDGNIQEAKASTTTMALEEDNTPEKTENIDVQNSTAKQIAATETMAEDNQNSNLHSKSTTNKTTIATIPVDENTAGNKQVRETSAKNTESISEGLRIKWELVYENDEKTNIPEEKTQAAPKIIDPVKQVQMVKYASMQPEGSGMDEPLEIFIEAEPLDQVMGVAYEETTIPIVDEEFLEISQEADPVDQVQMIKYAAAQSEFPEDEESLELILEPDPIGLVETVAFTADNDPVNDIREELEIRLESEPIKQVQLVEVESAQVDFPEDEELLELNIEADPVMPAEAVEFVDTPDPILISDEPLEIRTQADMIKQVEVVEYSTLPYTPGEDEALEIRMHRPPSRSDKVEVSSLSASESGFITYPEVVSIPESLNMNITNNQMIRAALNKPDKLSYEELLYAASISDNPDAQLEIYYNSFIRIDRDWRAYYNASEAARKASNFDQAELYLYQARLIYKGKFMGQGEHVLKLEKK